MISQTTKRKKVFVSRLIDAWMQGFRLQWVVHRALEEEGKREHAFADIESFLVDVYGKRLFTDQPVRTWLPRGMPTLNEALWTGRPRDRLQYIGECALGVRHAKTSPVIVKARSLSKDHDWGTVK